MQTCAELAMVVSDCQYVARECKPTTFNSSFIVTCNISDVMTFENITRTPPAISHEMTTEQANVDWVYLLWGFSCLHCCAPLKLVNPILARNYESTSLKLHQLRMRNAGAYVKLHFFEIQVSSFYSFPTYAISKTSSTISLSRGFNLPTRQTLGRL